MKFVLVARILHGMTLLKAQVEPEKDRSHNCRSPRQPNVPGSWRVDQISGSLTVLIAQEQLREEDADGQPSVATLNRFIFAFHGAPSQSIYVSFSVSYRAKAEPHEQTCNREEMLGLD